MSFGEKGTVRWGGDLEKIADMLLAEAQSKIKSPFDKVCIVINDPATENWLKQYWLLEKKTTQILMNFDFVKLPEFLNDWLAAQLHGIPPRLRKAKRHPYSPEVMTWRIYRILSQADPDGELRKLLNYVGKENAPRRRWSLSQKLAKLYDDYQNSRIRMLRNWERGNSPPVPDIPEWQIPLYRMLAAEDPRTYARDYEIAFDRQTDPSRAFDHGFPRYCAIHVLDIPFMTEPMLHLLEKLSEAIPLTFWCFNPENEWLADSHSKQETLAAFRKLRDALNAGAFPEETVWYDANAFYSSPAERLFGALASGARALIRSLCDASYGNVDVVEKNKNAIDRLHRSAIAIHECYSPRRELEAVKNELHRFFADHPDASPHQAAILCADWENYAPILETVFGSDANVPGYLPVTAAGGGAGETPFLQSFRALLEFRKNRFEVEALFDLLDVPPIREKFAISDSGVSTLRSMVQEANIRWGFDDADIDRVLEKAPEDAGSRKPYSFTWQRGLDRMIAEMLAGSSETGCELAECGKLGTLHPCGHVEGERANLLASLWSLVSALNQLRNLFPPDTESSVDETAASATWIIDTFYVSNEETLKSLVQARQAVRSTAEAMKAAALEKIDPEVFFSAVTDALAGFVPIRRTQGNAVLFAPLNCFTATPRRFIWICGLNDGSFPPAEYRASYDLIGIHPSLFDATPRERGSFALLKAALCAKEELAFSYVGCDIRTNKTVPPSVLLNDFKDYFAAVGIAYRVYHHPMRSYSRNYFRKAADAAAELPRSYSAADEAIAAKLAASAAQPGIIPFPLNEEGLTEIALEELASFCSTPNNYLFQSRDIRIASGKYGKLESKECFAAKLDRAWQKEIALTGSCAPRFNTVMVEQGSAPDEISAAEVIEKQKQSFNRLLSFKDPDYNGLDNDGKPLRLADAYNAGQETNAVSQTAEIVCGDHRVRLTMQYTVRQLKTETGLQKFSFYYDAFADKTSAQNRVLIRHLGANAAEGNVATVLFGADGNCILFKMLSQEEARNRLSAIIGLLSTPLPPEYPDFTKTDPRVDLLPSEWQQLLSANNPA